ncbi:alanine--tRNA ligase [Candidatus Gottesmanbacteria bacterium]|nr:alanine--tRNA ligase [Candidatus Gottesmanbacteria bacterium]
MKSAEVRKKFIEFYKARGHVEVPSASLVPENDPTTLFTSSGMQPLVPYLLGQTHPLGNRLVNSQKAFRAQDIEEVGNNRHTTFFEMLGNWSLGDYFKKEQLPWIWEFLTKELGLPKERLYVSVFEGDKNVPRDEESAEIWKKLGVPEEKIFSYDITKNWWSRAGEPSRMPPGEPGGPDSEVFYEFTQVEHDPKFGKHCHPNCDCGRFMEIANSVFMQYRKNKDGSLEELPNKNVDFGGGLERLVAVTENTPDVFDTDLFLPIIQKIEEVTHQSYSEDKNKTAIRAIADHVKAATFLIVDGVMPSNKERGYIVRRLLRSASVKFAFLRDNPGEYLPPELTTTVLTMYDGVHTIDEKKQGGDVYRVVEEEIRKFQKTLHLGLKVLQKTTFVDGRKAFDLYQTYGFPLEVTIEILKGKGKTVEDVQGFHEEFKKHQELSRTAAKGMFKGGLADHSEEVTKLHTATHLLHQALRVVLGPHVSQKGSNITAERLRFDFSHPNKLTDEQLKRVSDLVNEKIKEDLPVSYEIIEKETALSSGALAFFGERYGEKVKVYTIGGTTAEPSKIKAQPSTKQLAKEKQTPFSLEICGGPHVAQTGALGHFTIDREESLGYGIRRIYATLT